MIEQYRLTFSMAVSSGWNPTPNFGPDDFVIHLYIKAHDGDGNEGFITLGDYTISEDCDDPPEPTATLE